MQRSTLALALTSFLSAQQALADSNPSQETVDTEFVDMEVGLVADALEDALGPLFHVPDGTDTQEYDMQHPQVGFWMDVHLNPGRGLLVKRSIRENTTRIEEEVARVNASYPINGIACEVRPSNSIFSGDDIYRITCIGNTDPVFTEQATLVEANHSQAGDIDPLQFIDHIDEVYTETVEIVYLNKQKLRSAFPNTDLSVLDQALRLRYSADTAAVQELRHEVEVLTLSIASQRLDQLEARGDAIQNQLDSLSPFPANDPQTLQRYVKLKSEWAAINTDMLDTIKYLCQWGSGTNGYYLSPNTNQTPLSRYVIAHSIGDYLKSQNTHGPGTDRLDSVNEIRFDDYHNSYPHPPREGHHYVVIKDNIEKAATSMYDLLLTSEGIPKTFKVDYQIQPLRKSVPRGAQTDIRHARAEFEEIKGHWKNTLAASKEALRVYKAQLENDNVENWNEASSIPQGLDYLYFL